MLAKQKVVIYLITVHFFVVPVILWHGAVVFKPLGTLTSRNESLIDCSLFARSFNVSYHYSVHREERMFPIAFSILVYRDLDRAIRLLRAIHRPQNVYCVHVDEKTDENYVKRLESALRCIGNNIFDVPFGKRLDVRWGTSTVLLPDIICAALLLKRSRSWKYFINLTGHEFPLKTNWEIVTALSALNGTNVVHSFYDRGSQWRMPPSNYTSFNVRYYKGSTFIAVRREFIEFVLHDRRSKELLRALMLHERKKGHGVVMDETFYATLHRNRQVFPIPGCSLEDPQKHTPSFTREVVWCGSYCGTKIFRNCVCMLGLLDLPRLLNSSALFANKFLPNVEPKAFDLLESWLSSKILYENLHSALHPSFNPNIYAESRIAWNHI